MIPALALLICAPSYPITRAPLIVGGRLSKAVRRRYTADIVSSSATCPLSTRQKPIQRALDLLQPSTLTVGQRFLVKNGGRPLQNCRSSPKQIVLDDAPYRPQSVLPVDLLAFGVCAPVVRDTDLIHAALELCNLRSDLRLETETVFFDGDALD